MPIHDPFKGQSAGAESPATHAFAITPDDGTELPVLPRGVILGTGGDLSVTMQSGDPVTFRNLVEGVVYPFRVRSVQATGTTATDIVGVY